MAVRLPRGDTLRVRLDGGRGWQADLQRIERRVNAGRPTKLYRGEILYGGKGLRKDPGLKKRGLRRLRNVERN